MVRLADLPDYEREHLLAKNMPPLGPATWVASEKPLAELRIALVTTAGLHFAMTLLLNSPTRPFGLSLIMRTQTI